MAGLQVVGGGLMRTGTNSLQLALQQLLDGKCYHGWTAIDNLSHRDFWIKACTEPTTDEEWRDFFKDYKAAVDFPSVAFYERLMNVYPSAKVVLTVRDSDAWYRSISNTVALRLRPTLLSCLRMVFSDNRKFAKMIDLLYTRMFGPGYDLDDRLRTIAAFEAHNKAVQAVVPKERLLVFRVKDGWGPLCDFLGLPVPDVAFPHVNSTDNYHEKQDKPPAAPADPMRYLVPVAFGAAVTAVVIRFVI